MLPKYIEDRISQLEFNTCWDKEVPEPPKVLFSKIRDVCLLINQITSTQLDIYPFDGHLCIEWKEKELRLCRSVEIYEDRLDWHTTDLNSNSWWALDTKQVDMVRYDTKLL